MNSCSCLALLLACVVYWQAKEISRVLKMGIPEGEDINISLLEHVNPIEWENVILCAQPGRHIFTPIWTGPFNTFFSQIKIRSGMEMGHVGQIAARFKADDVCVRCYNPE